MHLSNKVYLVYFFKGTDSFSCSFVLFFCIVFLLCFYSLLKYIFHTFFSLHLLYAVTKEGAALLQMPSCLEEKEALLTKM